MYENKEVDRDEQDMDLILNKVKEVWMEYPYLRFGEMIEKVFDGNTGFDNPYYMTSGAIMQLFEKFRQNNK